MNDDGERKAALLFGATGLIGGFCLEHLLAEPRYSRVHVVVRRPLARKHPKLEEHVVDFAALGGTSLPRVDDVYVALGTTIAKAGSQDAFRAVDHDAVVAAADAGKRAGASALAVVSSVGADEHARSFYLRVKGETERDLRAQSWRTLEIMRPSLLLGARAERRVGERIAIVLFGPLAFLVAGPLSRYRPIEAERVALAMVAALAQPEPGEHVRELDAMVTLTPSRSVVPVAGIVYLVVLLIALGAGIALLAR